MKKIKVLICIIFVMSLATGIIVNNSQEVMAKNKQVIICKMSNKKITCRKSIFVSQYIDDAGWENIIGYGKSKNIKISSKAKYYLLGIYSNKLKKVTRKKFKKEVKRYYSGRFKEKGKVYYVGMACKITIKNGKIVKFKQVYQA